MLRRAWRTLLSRVFKSVLLFEDGSWLRYRMRERAFAYAPASPAGAEVLVPVSFEPDSPGVPVRLSAAEGLSWSGPPSRPLTGSETADLRDKLARFVASKGLPFLLSD
jgi:hypothetical protein